MNLGQLRDRARSETQDLERPYLWSDDDWRDYFNEAADEAAIRARLIEDDQIEVDVTAGDAYADYPEHVWAIQRVYFGSKRLILSDRETLDATEPQGWEDRQGDPQYCYEVGGRLRFYPAPLTSGTARLVAFCVPATPMANDEDTPQLRQRIHAQLLDWALFLAYSRKDADTFDANLAEKHAAAFEKVFGPRPDEKAMRRKRANVRRFVAGSYF